jgi:hypothetical protein
MMIMKRKLVKKATLSLTRNEAAALLSAVSIALDANGGDAPKSVAASLAAAVEALNEAFDFGLEEATA